MLYYKPERGLKLLKQAFPFLPSALVNAWVLAQRSSEALLSTLSSEAGCTVIASLFHLATGFGTLLSLPRLRPLQNLGRWDRAHAQGHSPPLYPGTTNCDPLRRGAASYFSDSLTS